MPQPDLFEQGVVFFHSGRYFEAHEVWEDLWRVAVDPARTFYQGLIQAAVALHHLERGNRTGARGQFTKSIRHLLNSLDNPHSIDTADLIRQLREIQDRMQPRTVRIARLK